MNLLNARYSLADRIIRGADARLSAYGFGWKDGEELRLAIRPEDLRIAMNRLPVAPARCLAYTGNAATVEASIMPALTTRCIPSASACLV